MPHHCLPHTFACLRVAAAAISLTFAFVALAPPAVLGQDAPAEEATPEVAPTEQAAPEQAAPEEEAPPNEAAPETPAAEETKSWDIAKPCENVQHPYQGDLCQQWRTAEAAEKTAAASKRTAALARLLMLIGAVATVLLLLMFVPLFMAAFGARRAARNADLGGGGSSSAPLADRDREEELRAYLDVDKLEFIETPESEGIVKVKVAFRNSGQTPAFKIRSATEIGIRDVADEDLVPTMPLPDRAKSATRARLGRDAVMVEITECPSTPSLADRVMNGDATIVVWGFAEYMDMFDRKRRTNFQYLCNADTLDTGQIFKPMVRGDEEL